MDDSGPSGLIHDDAVIGENHESEVYALSKLRRSRRIANCVEQLSQQRWGANHIVNNEESEEEDEDIADNESMSNFDVDGDEGLEGDDEGNDIELVAAQGQEGISLWDILGEGFLKEASQLGICCFGIIF
jgi:hypothetical protein